jgi:phage gp29-like protein
LGILSRLAPWILFKTLAFKSWGIYTETYALPNMVWKTPIKDKAKNDEFMETIKNLGNNVKILLDKEDDFELIQPSSTDAYQTFAQLIDVVDTTIANEICGGALLFKSGSGGGGGGSYGLSATHEEVSKLKTKSDLSEIARYVNSFLIPKLKRLGLIKPNYNCMFSFSDTENLTRQELITILTPVMQNFDVNKEWLEKALNIKIDNKKNGGAGQSIEEQPQ